MKTKLRKIFNFFIEEPLTVWFQIIHYISSSFGNWNVKESDFQTYLTCNFFQAFNAKNRRKIIPTIYIIQNMKCERLSAKIDKNFILIRSLQFKVFHIREIVY